MELILIRHADPDYANDVITETGHWQAERLGIWMARTRLDVLYCSPMGRARLTSDYIARATGLTPIILPWLHELNGNYAGEQWAWNEHGCDVFQKTPSLSMENWTQCVPYGNHMLPVMHEFCASFDAFMMQYGLVRRQALYEITHEWRDTFRLALVCHAGVILTLLSHLLHVPLPICYSQFSCDPTSRTTLRLVTKEGCGIFRLICLNDTSHTAEGAGTFGRK